MENQEELKAKLAACSEEEIVGYFLFKEECAKVSEDQQEQQKKVLELWDALPAEEKATYKSKEITLRQNTLEEKNNVNDKKSPQKCQLKSHSKSKSRSKSKAKNGEEESKQQQEGEPEQKSASKGKKRKISQEEQEHVDQEPGHGLEQKQLELTSDHAAEQKQVDLEPNHEQKVVEIEPGHDAVNDLPPSDLPAQPVKSTDTEVSDEKKETNEEIGVEKNEVASKECEQLV